MCSVFLFPYTVVRVLVCFYSILLILNGDVEINQGLLSNCK